MKHVPFFPAFFAFALVGLLASCQEELLSSQAEVRPEASRSVDFRGSSNKGGKKKKGEEPAPDPEPDPDAEISYATTFHLVETGEALNPLYRFSFSESGDLVLLESDPGTGVWGSDYYGYWAEPFERMQNAVSYTIGLNDYTYAFALLPDGRVEVTYTHVRRPYLSGDTVTTVAGIGIFAPVE